MHAVLFGEFSYFLPQFLDTLCDGWRHTTMIARSVRLGEAISVRWRTVGLENAWRTNGEHVKLRSVDERCKRVILIAASILAARKQAQHVGSRVEKEIVRG